MGALRHHRSEHTRCIADAVMSAAPPFAPETLELIYSRVNGHHVMIVNVPGWRMVVRQPSSLDLPGYPEMVEAAEDQWRRRGRRTRVPGDNTTGKVRA